jgi:hypothetical protein
VTNLRLPPADELPEADREIIERLAARMGSHPDQMSDIWRAQYHWPQYLEANHQQTLYSFRYQGVLTELQKQAMHVAVSMVNHCEY